jgi:hypothetical protein
MYTANFIRTRGWTEGYMLMRHFGIPMVRYMEGSVVIRQRFGFTMYHALKRAQK